MRRAILSLFWVVVGLFFGGSNSWAEETAQEEAIRRIPPVLHSLTIPDKLISGESYTITWSLVGYESDYKTIVVFFDCTDVASPNCGNAYSNPKLEASDKLTATSVGVGAWSYQGTSSFRLDYSYTFTPTVTADTETVIRFYYLNEADNANDRPSISLMPLVIWSMSLPMTRRVVGLLRLFWQQILCRPVHRRFPLLKVKRSFKIARFPKQ